MRIPRRELVSPGQYVHLMQRGNNRRRLFSYPSDYAEFAGLMTRSASRTGCAVHALCLMANHVHLLVRAPTVDALAGFVKGYAQVYARRRNARRGGSGKLFEERYKSPPVTCEAQFMATVLYIERNPVAANLKPAPGDYPWSSHRLHIGRQDNKLPNGLWTPSGWYLGLGKTQRERAARFVRLFEAYDASKLSPEQRDAIAHIEKASAPYTRRLERPNRTRAQQRRARYAVARDDVD